MLEAGPVNHHRICSFINLAIDPDLLLQRSGLSIAHAYIQPQLLQRALLLRAPSDLDLLSDL